MTSVTLRNFTRCALLTAVLCVCAWISLPLPGIPVTMQTFGVVLALLLLGGKWGTAAIGLYLALGLVGLPVFSGFQSGAAALAGPAGGFLWGFLATGLVYWLVRRPVPALILGLAACYACGAGWYWLVWLEGQGSVLPVLAQWVLPYAVPDGIKLLLAWQVAGRLRRFS